MPVTATPESDGEKLFYKRGSVLSNLLLEYIGLSPRYGSRFGEIGNRILIGHLESYDCKMRDVLTIDFGNT